MQSQVMVTGSIVGSGAAGDLSLTITSMPPCALPVAENCSSRNFDPSEDQWAAYTTEDFLTAYIAEHKLTSLQTLFAQATSDFLPTTVAEGLICNPDAGALYACTPPSSLTNCDASSQDSTKGFLIVWSLVRFSHALTLLYQALGDAQGDLVGLMRTSDRFLLVETFSKWRTCFWSQRWPTRFLPYPSILPIHAFEPCNSYTFRKC